MFFFQNFRKVEEEKEAEENATVVDLCERFKLEFDSMAPNFRRVVFVAEQHLPITQYYEIETLHHQEIDIKLSSVTKKISEQQQKAVDACLGKNFIHDLNKIFENINCSEETNEKWENSQFFS